MTVGDLLAQGKAIVTRFADQKGVSKTLAPHVASFTGDYTQLAAAAVKVEKAQAARDKALGKVGGQDDVLDPSVLDLANTLVGGGIGERKNPFAKFSKYTPSTMVDLPYATEAGAVHDLCAAIKAKTSLPVVLKAVQQCDDNATAVEQALDDLVAPQTAYVQALGERDALLPGFQKSLQRLKKHAGAAWADEPAIYKAVFAPPDRLQQPVKRRKKKAGTETGTGTGAGTGTGTQAPQAVKGAEAQPLLVVEPEQLAAAGGEPAVAKGKKT